MTVPGKGGRPRKWQSDADRVRAFRARQRGDEEPPSVDEAVDRSGELAVAWSQVRNLTAIVEDQKETIRRLQRDVRALERRVDDERRRFSWIDAENTTLRAELNERETALQMTEAPNDPIDPSQNAARIEHSELGMSGRSPNRAQRRQASRDRRRKRP